MTVNGVLPSKLVIYIDSQEVYGETVTYNGWFRKNVTLYVTQELDSTPEIDFEEKESSIQYCIRLENCSFSWAMTMITFFKLYYSEGRLLRDPDWVIQIIIREPFTSFFMQFETFKEDG